MFPWTLLGSFAPVPATPRPLLYQGVAVSSSLWGEGHCNAPVVESLLVPGQLPWWTASTLQALEMPPADAHGEQAGQQSDGK